MRKSASGGESCTASPFSSAIGCTMSRTDSRMSADGERNRIEVHQPVAATGQLDHVARHRAQSERRAVDEAELPLLHLVDRPAPAALQGLGEKENRGERRPKVVGDLDDQLQAVGAGEPVGEMLRPIGLEPLAHRLHGADGSRRS